MRCCSPRPPPPARTAFPLVAGTTAEEMNLYVDPGAAAPARDKLARRIARLAGIEAEAAARAVDAYEADLGDIDKVFPTVFTDVMMHRPLKKVLDAHTPSYTYSFDWRAPRLGAFHAVDIPFTFDSFDVDGWGEFVGADDDAFRIGRELRDAWGTFARTGDPGWPAYPAAHVFAARISRRARAPRATPIGTPGGRAGRAHARPRVTRRRARPR